MDRSDEFAPDADSFDQAKKGSFLNSFSMAASKKHLNLNTSAEPAETDTKLQQQ